MQEECFCIKFLIGLKEKDYGTGRIEESAITYDWFRTEC